MTSGFLILSKTKTTVKKNVEEDWLPLNDASTMKDAIYFAFKQCDDERHENNEISSPSSLTVLF